MRTWPSCGDILLAFVMLILILALVIIIYGVISLLCSDISQTSYIKNLTVYTKSIHKIINKSQTL